MSYRKECSKTSVYSYLSLRLVGPARTYGPFLLSCFIMLRFMVCGILNFLPKNVYQITHRPLYFFTHTIYSSMAKYSSLVPRPVPVFYVARWKAGMGLGTRLAKQLPLMHTHVKCCSSWPRQHSDNDIHDKVVYPRPSVVAPDNQLRETGQPVPGMRLEHFGSVGDQPC